MCVYLCVSYNYDCVGRLFWYACACFSMQVLSPDVKGLDYYDCEQGNLGATEFTSVAECGIVLLPPCQLNVPTGSSYFFALRQTTHKDAGRMCSASLLTSSRRRPLADVSQIKAAVTGCRYFRLPALPYLFTLQSHLWITVLAISGF